MRSTRRGLLVLLLLGALAGPADAATVASLGITFNTTAGDKTVVATPTVNDLIVVVAAASGTSEANASTTAVSDTGTGGTYTKVTESSAGSSPRISVWIRNALVPSATSTTYTATQTSSSGGGLEVFRVTSLTRTGSLAARGFASGSNTGGQAPAVTLQQAALTGNPLVGGVTNGASPATLTPPTAWTESQDVGYSTPPTGLETAFVNSGETGTTITWGSTSASAWRASVVELDPSAAPTCPPPLALLGVGC